VKEKDILIKSDNKQIVLYAEKEDGTYGQVQTGPYMLTNFQDDYWAKIDGIEETCRQKVLAGVISPIDYWRQIRMMTVADLASRVGLSQGAVKKHFLPDHFKKMNAEIRKRYGEIMGIPETAFDTITKEFTMRVIYKDNQ
jgi:hypothetical protein